MFHCRDCALFCKGLILLPPDLTLIHQSKLFQLSLTSPQNVVPKVLRLISMVPGKLQANIFVPLCKEWSVCRGPLTVCTETSVPADTRSRCSSLAVTRGFLFTFLLRNRVAASDNFFFLPRPGCVATDPVALNFLTMILTMFLLMFKALEIFYGLPLSFVKQ